MEKLWLKSYPSDISYDIQISKVPLYTFLDSSAEKYPDHTALKFFTTTITYATLHRMVNNFAASLSRLGVKKGDRVALFLPNCPHAVIAYYAILKLGAIVVQINPLYVEREIACQLKDSGSRVLLYLDLFSKKVSNILEQVSLDTLIAASLKEFLNFPYATLISVKSFFSGVSVVSCPGSYSFMELISTKGDPAPVRIDLENDPALIQYTGGTTGVSKGVMLSHENLVANVMQAKTWFSRIDEGKEIFLSVIPFSHAFGMTVCMNLPLLIGASIIIVPKFNVSNILRIIHNEKPTIFPGVPTIYVAINTFPRTKRYNLSSIRFCISGAAPLPIEVMNQFEELTGGKLVEGYGLSEASPITHCNPLFFKKEEKKEGSIGLPLPATDCKIVSLENREKELASGEIGELVIKGPQVMKGYWNREEENKEKLVDGWLFTGDIAKVDEAGYFYIVGRKKDMIISGGFNIYPREIEDILSQHKKISESAVVGVTDSYFGEKIKAYIVLKKGYMASETEIIEFCKRNLAKYKIPHFVEFREDLPKNMLGKVLRRKIRES